MQEVMTYFNDIWLIIKPEVDVIRNMTDRTKRQSI